MVELVVWGLVVWIHKGSPYEREFVCFLRGVPLETQNHQTNHFVDFNPLNPAKHSKA